MNIDNSDRPEKPAHHITLAGGVAGESPGFLDPSKGGCRICPGSPAGDRKAHALPDLGR